MQRLGRALKQLTPRSHVREAASCTSGQIPSCTLHPAAAVASPSSAAGLLWPSIRQLGFSCSALCRQEFIALNTLRDNPGATHSKKRRGRGIGSGLGKTAGRGHKGQKARAGRSPKIGFEGGQTPLRQRVPKRGFRNPHALDYVPLNLTKLMRCVETKRLDTSQVITMKDLRDCGAVHRKVGDGIKLLARGSPSLREKKLPIHLQVSSASAEARAAIEAAGGSVTTVYYNKLGMRALLQPDFFRRHQRLLPRPARPPPRLADGRFDVIGSLPPDTRIGQLAAEGGVTHEVLGMRAGVSNRQKIGSSMVAEQL